MSHYLSVVRIGHDHVRPILVRSLNQAGIVLGNPSFDQILPLVGEKFGCDHLHVGRQVSFFKFYGSHTIPYCLAIGQDTFHVALAQAFEIDAFDLFGRHAQPRQQAARFETQLSAQAEAGCESTIEAVPTPTCGIGFDTPALASIRAFTIMNTTWCVHADPARTGGLATCGEIGGDIKHALV